MSHLLALLNRGVNTFAPTSAFLAEETNETNMSVTPVYYVQNDSLFHDNVTITSHSV